MSDSSFISFRNEILRSLDKFDVKYKLFGGSVVQLIDVNRETEDVDVMIERNLDCVERFIRALEDCGFALRQSLTEQIFGVGNSFGEAPLESTCAIYPDKEIWVSRNYRVDLCFNIGLWEYSTTPEEVIERDGLNIHTVSFLEVARMKANVYPRPRPQDINDIQFIADYLGLDTSTGAPKKTATKKKGWWRK